MTKTLRQFIFESLKEKGCILDNEIYKFLGREPNFATVEKYKREYQNLEFWKSNFKEFEDDKETEIRKGHRCYLLGNKRLVGDKYYKIPKIYFDYLKYES